MVRPAGKREAGNSAIVARIDAKAISFASQQLKLTRQVLHPYPTIISIIDSRTSQRCEQCGLRMVIETNVVYCRKCYSGIQAGSILSQLSYKREAT